MWRMVLFAVLFTGATEHAAAIDFPAAGGPIPDNAPAGLDVPFLVSGLTLPVRNVQVSITLSHPRQGDLRATLVAPGGAARLVLFGRAGHARSGAAPGVDSDLAGTYVFSDAGSGDYWQAIAASPVPVGSYRTSTAGRPGLSNAGGCASSLALAFRDLRDAQLNGSWTLNVADLAASDVGLVTSAVLSIDGEPYIFGGDFDEGVPPAGVPSGSRNCRRAHFDFTGTGLSSYAVVRNTGGGPNGAVTWFVQENDGTTGGASSDFVHGTATDFFLDGDFDADGIADATVWQPTPGRFVVRRSAQPGAQFVLPFGMQGDAPNHIGDYDGDGIDDPATYRAGASGQPSTMRILLSSTGAVRSFTAGEGGAFVSGGEDHDGDARADVVVQTGGAGGMGRYRIYRGTDGQVIADVQFGSLFDRMAAGNHSGDARADITAVGESAGQYQWTTRDGTSGVLQPPVLLGATATDFLVGGDYDGDGLDDYATWRLSAMPGQSRFIVRRSSTPAVPLEVPLGQNGDYPVANGRTY